MEAKVRRDDVLMDNDPRRPGRTLKVKSVGAMRAMCESAPGRYVYVLLTRIHDDGKVRVHAGGFCCPPSNPVGPVLQ
jgi:hypothetical protein